MVSGFEMGLDVCKTYILPPPSPSCPLTVQVKPGELARQQFGNVVLCKDDCNRYVCVYVDVIYAVD